MPAFIATPKDVATVPQIIASAFPWNAQHISRPVSLATPEHAAILNSNEGEQTPEVKT